MIKENTLDTKRINVLPVNDLFEHTRSEFCLCHPTTEQHPNGLVVIHNSWDGRELSETDRNVDSSREIN